MVHGLFLGDFNECGVLDDKSGGNEWFTRGMEDLNDWCYNAEVDGIRSNGLCYTWANKCDCNPFLRKLDLSLVNFKWSMEFPASEVTLRAPLFSDHNPIHLKLNLSCPKRNPPFRFFKFWMSNPCF